MTTDPELAAASLSLSNAEQALADAGVSGHDTLSHGIRMLAKQRDDGPVPPACSVEDWADAQLRAEKAETELARLRASRGDEGLREVEALLQTLREAACDYRTMVRPTHPESCECRAAADALDDILDKLQLRAMEKRLAARAPAVAAPPQEER